MGQIEREGPMQSESRGWLFSANGIDHITVPISCEGSRTQAASIEVHYETEKKRTQDENSPEGHIQSTRVLL